MKLISLFSLIMVMEMPTSAFALDQKVRDACTGDYFEFCANTVPGTEQCRRCFIKYGRALSRSCKTAIKNSSEFANDYENERKRYVKD